MLHRQLLLTHPRTKPRYDQFHPRPPNHFSVSATAEAQHTNLNARDDRLSCFGLLFIFLPLDVSVSCLPPPYPSPPRGGNRSRLLF